MRIHMLWVTFDAAGVTLGVALFLVDGMCKWSRKGVGSCTSQISLHARLTLLF